MLTDAEWTQYWYGDLGMALKEPLTNVVFFYRFALYRGLTTTILTYVLSCLLASIDYDL